MKRRHARSRTERSPCQRQDGYTLVVLAVAITVLNIMVAAALPYWSTVMKREKEEELIFRGLQYAEGVRLFQRRFGRLPVRLEELIEVQPRCMRQLWKDPMTDSGKWGLIFANAQGANGRPNPNAPSGNRGNDGAQSGTDLTPGSGLPAPGREGDDTVTVGPIVGVRSLSTDDSMLEFNGQTTYDAWQFTVGMVTGSVGTPGQPGGIPNLNVRWVGRPLRKGITAPPNGGVPTQLRDQGRNGRRPGARPGANPAGRPFGGSGRNGSNPPNLRTNPRRPRR